MRRQDLKSYDEGIVDTVGELFDRHADGDCAVCLAYRIEIDRVTAERIGVELCSPCSQQMVDQLAHRYHSKAAWSSQCRAGPWRKYQNRNPAVWLVTAHKLETRRSVQTPVQLQSFLHNSAGKFNFKATLVRTLKTSATSARKQSRSARMSSRRLLGGATPKLCDRNDW